METRSALGHSNHTAVSSGASVLPAFPGDESGSDIVVAGQKSFDGRPLLAAGGVGEALAVGNGVHDHPGKLEYDTRRGTTRGEVLAAEAV